MADFLDDSVATLEPAGPGGLLILADENDPLAILASALAAEAGAHLVRHVEALGSKAGASGQVRADPKSMALARSSLQHPEPQSRARIEWETELQCEQADWRESFPNDPHVWAAGMEKAAGRYFEKQFKGMGVDAYYRNARNTALEVLPEAIAENRAALLDLWLAGQMSLPEIAHLSYRLTTDLASEIAELERQRQAFRTQGAEARAKLDAMHPMLARLGAWARRLGRAGRHFKEAVKLLIEAQTARTLEEHFAATRDVLGELMRGAWQTASDVRRLESTLRNAAERCRLDWERKARQGVPRLLRSNRAQAWRAAQKGLPAQVAKALLQEQADDQGRGWSALVSMDEMAWQAALLSQAARAVSQNPPPLAGRRAGDVDWAELIARSAVELGLAESSPLPLRIEVHAPGVMPMLAELLEEAGTNAALQVRRPLAVACLPVPHVMPIISLRFSEAPADGMEVAWQIISSAALTASFHAPRFQTVS